MRNWDNPLVEKLIPHLRWETETTPYLKNWYHPLVEKLRHPLVENLWVLRPPFRWELMRPPLIWEIDTIPYLRPPLLSTFVDHLQDHPLRTLDQLSTFGTTPYLRTWEDPLVNWPAVGMQAACDTLRAVAPSPRPCWTGSRERTGSPRGPTVALARCFRTCECQTCCASPERNHVETRGVQRHLVTDIFMLCILSFIKLGLFG